MTLSQVQTHIGIKIMFDITPKTIHKNLKVAKVFLKELFKFYLSNKANKWLSCFILNLSITYYS